MPDQIFPALDRTGVTVGYHEKVIRHGGNGVIVMISDYYAVIHTTFPNQSLDFVNVHGIYLSEWLVQNVERGVAEQYQIQFRQPGFPAGELIYG